jgi:putative membrane protein
MTKLVLKYVSIVATIYLLSYAITAIRIDSIPSLLLMGFILLIVNMLVKPVLLIITLPLNLITFGLFTFIVNAWTIMLADHFATGVSMGGFLNSLLAAFIISILHHMLRDAAK